MLIPALMVGLITIHLAILWLQKHTQFPGGRATEMNVVGRHFWPGQAFRSLGLMFLTTAVLAGVAGLVQINPVWVYGPFLPYAVSSPAQPDWYLGWLEGSLRLGPNWEPTILGVTIRARSSPGSCFPPSSSAVSRCGRSSSPGSATTTASIICSSTLGRPRNGRPSGPAP